MFINQELVVSLAIGAAVAVFVPNPVHIAALIKGIAIQFFISGFFQTVGEMVPKMASVCEWWRGETFALFTGTNVQTLIHETGHALAAHVVYPNARPRIEIVPFGGGITRFNTEPGGIKRLFVVASGPGLALLVSSVALAIGIAIRKKYPQVGKILICYGVFDFLHHAQYAYSALLPSLPHHDFALLAAAGLNPVVATIAILAIPLLIKAFSETALQKGS